MHIPSVITYQSPNGPTMDICTHCEKRLVAAGEWPKDSRGGEYSTVSHGQHFGYCGLSAAYAAQEGIPAHDLAV